MEPKRALDELPACPSEMKSKVGNLMANAQSNAQAIHSQIKAVQDERDAALESGRQFLLQFVTKFMQHAESSI